MRSTSALVTFALSAHAALAGADALTFEDIVRREAADPAALARTADLARLRSMLATTSKYTREGPTLEADAGPRWMGDGATKLEASARLEVPFLADRGARAGADTTLRDAGPDIVAAEAIESRLRLRAAYLDAWYAQERLELAGLQIQSIEALLASVRKRVEEGAEAPYEASLVEGELLRSLADSDASRVTRGEAWGALRALAELPTEPLPLAFPGLPVVALPEDAPSRFEAGVLRKAVVGRGSVELAFADLDLAQRRSRWFAAAAIAKEADESYATVGAAYRFPNRGESAALSRERASLDTALNRDAAVATSTLTTRFETARERAKRFGKVTSPEEFDEALRAIALRVELGKERPSVALPVRRQLLDARAAALQRVRDAHRLIAEIDALLAGEAP